MSSLASLQRRPTASGRQLKPQFSEVMVSFGEDKDYRFSKPKQVTDTPPLQTMADQGASKDVEPVKPFVFSPPLLRSASCQRKSKEFARLGLRQSGTR